MRRSLILSMALLLVACGGRYGIRDSTPVEPPKGMALIVMGFSYTGALSRSADSEKMGCPAHNAFGRSRFYIDFARLTDVKGSKEGYEIALNDIVCAKSSPDSPVRYTIFHVRPGTYQMTAVTAINGRRFETQMINRPRFVVGEGEFVYLGDILAETMFPAKLRYARTDPGARRAFGARGGDEQKLVVRPMFEGNQVN